MKSLTFEQVVHATGGSLVRPGQGEVSGVSIDSRKVQPGELFIAIKGERFDGHSFLGEVAKAGAAGVVVSKAEELPESGAVILVKDTRRALGDLARLYRSTLPVRVLAVTGSNGKTTTREMIGHILSHRFRVVKAEGSFNNDIGVPLTVFRLEPSTEVGVFEIEMNELGGTARLAQVCGPEVGVVTNIGDSHLESMKDRAGVAREKAELLEALPENGCAVLNADDPLVMGIGAKYAGCRKLTFGVEQRADVFATDVRELGLEGIEFTLQGEFPVRLPSPGRFQVANCLAAAAACSALGMELRHIAGGIEGFEPPSMRLAIRKFPNLTLIDDCYNANPQSMREAIRLLCANTRPEHRVAVLGDMLELGEHSVQAHTELGQWVAGCVDRVAFVGREVAHAVAVAVQAGRKPGRMRLYESSELLLPDLFDIVRRGDTLLVKGSRAMHLELVTRAITEHYD